MPKKAIKEKKLPNDLDIVNLLLHGKCNEKIESPNLRLKKHISGAVYLIFKSANSETVIAEYGKIEGGFGSKSVLLVNPIAGTAEIWRAIFGGFNAQNIYNKKGFIPIDIHQAMEIYSQVNSPILQLE